MTGLMLPPIEELDVESERARGPLESFQCFAIGRRGALLRAREHRVDAGDGRGAGRCGAADAADLSEPPFLEVVEIAVGLADHNAHYHVPLLVTPWAYSTYRGS